MTFLLHLCLKFKSIIKKNLFCLDTIISKDSNVLKVHYKDVQRSVGEYYLASGVCLFLYMLIILNA